MISCYSGHGGAHQTLSQVSLHSCLRFSFGSLHSARLLGKDPYRAHRIAQAFEIAQFINSTHMGSLAVLMGDLNSQPVIHTILGNDTDDD